MKRRKPTELGTALLMLRTIKRWTQAELARASGVRNSRISEYERGLKVPGVEIALRLLDAMGFGMEAFDKARLVARQVMRMERRGELKD